MRYCVGSYDELLQTPLKRSAGDSLLKSLRVLQADGRSGDSLWVSPDYFGNSLKLRLDLRFGDSGHALASLWQFAMDRVKYQAIRHKKHTRHKNNESA